MRTTIDLPDDLFRRCKIAAARRGTTLKRLVAEALVRHLDHRETEPPVASGWRAAFGLAAPDDVAGVDAAVEEEFGRIDPETWR